MTNEQKQIAIAEFEGWEKITNWKWKNSTGRIYENWSGGCPLPPYLTSRDAICGAVERLDEHKSLVFVFKLDDLLKRNLADQAGCEKWGATRVRNMILATPAQMADALLLTLGFEI